MAMMRTETLVKLLSVMNTMLNANDESMDILLIGGANMCLVQKSRNWTHDIDTYTKQQETIMRYRQMVSEAMKIDKTWINDVGEMFVTEKILEDSYMAFSHSNLRVFSPSDKAMLALKVASGRGEETKDMEDAAFLIKKLRIKNISEIREIIEHYKPGYWGKFGAEEAFCKKALKLAYTE